MIPNQPTSESPRSLDLSRPTNCSLQSGTDQPGRRTSATRLNDLSFGDSAHHRENRKFENRPSPEFVTAKQYPVQSSVQELVIISCRSLSICWSLARAEVGAFVVPAASQ
jgi:hypothetical protein